MKRAPSKPERNLIFGFVPRSPHSEVARHQREYLREAADRIERGESLAGLDHWFIACALRAFADRIPDAPKNPRGRKPEVDPGGLALRYAFLVDVKGMSKFQARGILADEANVSETAIMKALAKHPLAKLVTGKKT